MQKLTGRNAEITYSFDDFQLGYRVQRQRMQSKRPGRGAARSAPRRAPPISPMANAGRLSIATDLIGDLDGKRFQIRSVGDRKIVCDFSDLNSLLLIRRLTGKQLSLRQIGKSVEQLEYAVEVRVGGSCIARFGNLVTSRFWGLLGFPATHFRLTRILPLLINPKT